MAPFVCCLRFEAVATFCQVLLVGVTTSNLSREHLATLSGSGKVLRKTSCIFWNLKQSRMQRRRILFPLGNLMLPSATLKSGGGACFVQLRQEQQNVNQFFSTKSISKHVTSDHSFSFLQHPENFQGGIPWIFPHRSAGSGLRVFHHPDQIWIIQVAEIDAPSDHNQLEKISGKGRKFPNVKNTREGETQKKNGGEKPIFPVAKSTKSPFF